MPPPTESLTAEPADKLRDALARHRDGDLEAAEKLYSEIAETDPTNAQALHMLGVIKGQKGDNQAAVKLIQRSVDADGQNASGFSDLSRALRSVGRYNDAIAAGRTAIELSPDIAEAHNNLGAALEALGRLDEAAAAYRAAIRLRPQYAIAWNNIGNVLHAQQRPGDAAAAFQKALEIDPAFVQAHNNMGNVLKDQGYLTAAVASYEQALARSPKYAEAHYNLGSAYVAQGRLDDSYAAYREALSCKPDLTAAHSSLVMGMNYHPRFSTADIYSESVRWAQVNAPRAAPTWQGGSISPDPNRPLRIGYVSPDFRQHSVSHFLEPVLARHDHARFQIFCYAEVLKPDTVTERLRSLSDGWFSTVGFSAGAIAERIHADRIDILVDLAGHTGGGRLRVFARRPAPVQISWLGYPNTTGLAAIDYRLTDDVADPEGESDQTHTEKLVRLPNGFLCFGPPRDAPEIAPPPAAKNGCVTFGSFNNLAKITDAVVDVWGQILNRVPDSRLFLKTKAFGDDDVRRRFIELFVERGVDRDRLTFTGWQAEARDHLSQYGAIDIALDTFPYNGTTTTCEALWMGVPVITLRGDRHAGRVGASILESIALKDFVAADSEAYVSMAVALAADTPRLSELRGGLRPRLEQGTLCDAAGFTSQLEDVFRSLWRQWCSEQSAERSTGLSGPDGDMPVAADASETPSTGPTTTQIMHDAAHYAALWPAWDHRGTATPDARPTHWHHLSDAGTTAESDAVRGLWARNSGMRHDGPWSSWVGIYNPLGKQQAADGSNDATRKRAPDVFDRMISDAIKQRNAGQLDQAERIYTELLEQRPDHAMARLYLGGIWLEQGKVDAAIEQMRAAAADLPDSAEARFNLGVALKTRGDVEGAIGAYQQAIAIQPDFAKAHNNLGTIYRERSQMTAAAAAFQQAVAVKPDYVNAYNNLGNTLRDLGQLAPALEAFRTASHISSDVPQTYNNMGNVLKDMGRPQEAVDAFNEAIRIRPNYALAYNNMTHALRALGKTTEAEAAARKAIELAPRDAEAYNSLGNTLKDLGRYDEAAVAYRQTLEIRPTHIRAHNNLLLMMNYAPMFSAADIYSESLEWDRVHAAPRRERQQPYRNIRDPNRLLRIGYVSPDFRRHSVSYYFESVARQHDRNQFSVVCYSEVRQPDQVTARLQGLVDGWRSTVGMSDAAIAERIRADRIDILVDLAGHTARNRLLAFAERPAPVQVTWLGYPNTTGMRAIDYKITDLIADPVSDAETEHTEALVRLPDGFLCYRPADDAPEVSPPPAASRGAITFGSFNNLAKITDDVVACWARLLERVPDARLFLKSRALADTHNRDRYALMFKSHGIAEDRVELAAWVRDTAGHLEAYSNIDVALDPFPYNGTTTTCEALWMGVPVITLAGERHAGRVGASILTYLGLTELVAQSESDYLDIASELAAAPERLAELRRSLRTQMIESPLCRSTHFASVIEAAYREMWRRWCADEDVQAFDVSGAHVAAVQHLSGVLSHVNAARGHMKASDLDGAAAQYEIALADQPDNATALVEAAVLAAQRGDPEHGLSLIDKALQVVPTDPSAHYNRALMLNAIGDLKSVVEPCRKAIELDSEMAAAHNLLGAALKDLGELLPAEQSLRRAIECAPSHAEAHYNLGILLSESERLTDAIASFRAAIEHKPAYAEAYNNMGLAYQASGDSSQALGCFERATQLRPDLAIAFTNLGAAMKSAGRHDAAIRAFERVVELLPESPDARFDLALVLEDAGRIDDAVEQHRRAVEINPEDPATYNNLGIALRRIGRVEEAITAYQTALSHAPDDPDTLNNFGVALAGLGRLGEAVDSYRRALAGRPDFADAFNNLGNALGDQGKLDEAIAIWREVLVRTPDLPEVHSNLIFCMNYASQIGQTDILEESAAWNRRHAVPRAEHARPLDNAADPNRRLRLGYVSPDLRTHSVSYFFEPLLAAHDHDRFEIYCYAEVARPDQTTERLRGLSDHWRSTVGLDHHVVAERIRKDKIDILVDMAGHSARNRLLAFAERPAPVQVSWLGYPNTTGMDAIDYRLTDAIADPPGEGDAHFVENLIRLPNGFLCYRPPDAAPAVAPPPSAENGFVTFGSFNTLSKVTTEVISVWAELMNRVPDSRLVLKARALGDADTRARVSAQFSDHGISAARLELLSRTPSLIEHLNIYRKVDIALDPFPYNGTTTTCEALWMGVPVVTLCGNRHAGRVGASILSRLDLPNFNAAQSKDYIERAASLAADLAELKRLRTSLRGTFEASPICNSSGFARDLENAYRNAWRNHIDKINTASNIRKLATSSQAPKN